MNFYICSTVRHLLFSLLKALSEPNEKHEILFFTDYQDTSLDSWDLAHLPDQVRVHRASRRRLRKQLTSSWSGKLCYFLAMRKLVAPGALHEQFYSALAEQNSALAQSFAASQDRKLWLYNERNKMARLFRLVNQDFFLIEEGTGNYHYFRTKWWRWPERILQGLPPRKLAIGEDRRCKRVLVSFPDQVPASIRHKAEGIEFLDTSTAKEQVRRIFATTCDLERYSDAIVLATSPLDYYDNISNQQKKALYETLIDTLTGMGMGMGMGRKIVLKLHPQENPRDYEGMTDNLDVLPQKLPLEVVILLSKKPVTILSFFTSAGLGLEPYFKLVELCERTDAKGYAVEKLGEWADRPSELEEHLRRVLAESER